MVGRFEASWPLEKGQTTRNGVLAVGRMLSDIAV